MLLQQGRLGSCCQEEQTSHLLVLWASEAQPAVTVSAPGIMLLCRHHPSRITPHCQGTANNVALPTPPAACGPARCSCTM